MVLAYLSLSVGVPEKVAVTELTPAGQSVNFTSKDCQLPVWPAVTIFAADTSGMVTVCVPPLLIVQGAAVTFPLIVIVVSIA